MKYIVAEDYKVSFKVDKTCYSVTVPAGMKTDFASVPSCLGVFGITRVGPYLEACVVHDFLYIAWQYVAERECPRRVDRRFADRV